MNIVGMGLPGYAYIDPTYYGGHEGLNLWTWGVNAVLADGKMRALFSMLFGASMLLIASKAAGDSALGPIQTHYRRAFWLLVIGALHGFLLWYGDILVFYAVAGMVAFPFRKLDPRLLIAVGAAVFFGLVGWDLYEHSHRVALHAAATAPGAAPAAIEAWQAMLSTMGPPPALGQADLAAFGGGFTDALQQRSRMFVMMHTKIGHMEYVEAFGLMLLGAGLFKTGFFTLGWSTGAYAAVIAAGYLICVPITAWLAWQAAAAGLDRLDLSEFYRFSAAVRLPIAMAHASVVMLLVRAGAVRWLTERLAAAGRMALTNYIAMSLITTIIFCGFGFGLFGELQRYQLYIVVAGLWAAILLWSKPWLSRFEYGPLEWVWRSLVRWSPQPLAKGAAAPAPAL